MPVPLYYRTGITKYAISVHKMIGNRKAVGGIDLKLGCTVYIHAGCKMVDSELGKMVCFVSRMQNTMRYLWKSRLTASK